MEAICPSVGEDVPTFGRRRSRPAETPNCNESTAVGHSAPTSRGNGPMLKLSRMKGECLTAVPWGFVAHSRASAVRRKQKGARRRYAARAPSRHVDVLRL